MAQPQKARRDTRRKTLAEQERDEEQALQNGPFSVLSNAQKNECKLVISCRNDKILIAKLLAFDRHFNMILEDVYETKSSTQGTSRYIEKMFLRGDTVVFAWRLDSQQ